MLMSVSNYSRKRCYKSKARRLSESASMEEQIEAARKNLKGKGRKKTFFTNNDQEKKYIESRKQTNKEFEEYRNEYNKYCLKEAYKKATSEQKRHIKNKKERRQILSDPSYDTYMKSDMWYRKREQFLENKKDRCCEVCGKENANQVHHRTYQRLRLEKMSDLLLLCRECHEKFHAVIPAKKMSKARSSHGRNNCAICYKPTSKKADIKALFEYRGEKVLCGRCVEIFDEDLCRAKWSSVDARK